VVVRGDDDFLKKFLRNFLRKSASTKPQPKLESPPGATLVVVRGDDDFLQKISAKFFKKICYNTNLDPHPAQPLWLCVGMTIFYKKFLRNFLRKSATTKTWIPTCVGMTIFYKKFLRNFLRKSVTC
jgi:hypothetical protein